MARNTSQKNITDCHLLAIIANRWQSVIVLQQLNRLVFHQVDHLQVPISGSRRSQSRMGNSEWLITSRLEFWVKADRHKQVMRVNPYIGKHDYPHWKEGQFGKICNVFLLLVRAENVGDNQGFVGEINRYGPCFRNEKGKMHSSSIH